MIDVGYITTLGRLREPDKKRVEALAESIKEVGLLNPITVCPATIKRNGQDVDGYALVAGGHRLAACKALGWSEIPATVMDLGEFERVIAECDENLCVAELSPAERSRFTAQRKAAYEALHPETVNGANQHTGRVRKLCEPSASRFTKDTANATGASERKVQLDAERGTKINPDALAVIEGTKLDTGVFLDKLKVIDWDKQVAFATGHLERFTKTASKPTLAPDPDNHLVVKERQVSALMTAWNKAGKDAREEFLARIDNPVMGDEWG